jgi:hypothetical protein
MDTAQFRAELVPVVNGVPGKAVADPALYGDAIACVSATQCVMAGSLSKGGAALQWFNGTRSTRVVPVHGASNLSGVACASAAYCVAVGWVNESVDIGSFAAVAVFSSATTSVKATVLTNFGLLNGVACPGPRLCLAVGLHDYIPGRGGVVQVTGGKIGPPRVYGGTGELQGVSCGSPTFCWVTGQRFLPTVGIIGELVGGIPGKVFSGGTGNGPGSLSCVNASTCYAGDGTEQNGFGQADKLVNGKIIASVLLNAFHSGSLTAVTCPTAASCLAAGPTGFQNPGLPSFYYTSATVSLGV